MDPWVPQLTLKINAFNIINLNLSVKRFIKHLKLPKNLKFKNKIYDNAQKSMREGTRNNIVFYAA